MKIRERDLAEEVLGYLGECVGSVIRDSRSGITYWLVESLSADQWAPIRGVSVLARGAYLAVPPAELAQPPGPHWYVPFVPGRYLTSSSTLLAALRLAAPVLLLPPARN